MGDNRLARKLFVQHMNSPLQLFRDLLPFTNDHADQKATANVHSLLEAVAGLPPQEVVVRLTSGVLPAAAGQANLHMRFKLLEDIRHVADSTLPVLEAYVSQAVLPLPLAATTSALQADNLIKSMAHAYASLARTIAKQQQNQGLSHLFHRAIQRAMALVARRQRLAYRAYAMPSATSWQMLHDLYRMGCDPLTMPLNGETAPIEHEYIEALLFAYIEPNKLHRSELDELLACTRQLAAYAVIADVAPDTLNTRNSESCFLVRPDEGVPGSPLSRVAPGSSIFGCLIVDCTQVLAALDRNISRIPGKTIEPDLRVSPAILQALRTAIAGKGSRRFSRTKFRPRGDVVGGLAQVVAFLDGRAFSRRSLDAFGRQDARDFAASEWAMVDESPDGFRLRFIKGEKWQIGVGDVVALQPRESSKVHVCLVRRITSTNNRLELGLQLMSPQVSVAELIVDEAPGPRVIFLHSLPAYGRFPGLIVPPASIRSGDLVTLRMPGRNIEHRIGKCMEANDGLEFYALEPSPL